MAGLAIAHWPPVRGRLAALGGPAVDPRATAEVLLRSLKRERWLVVLTAQPWVVVSARYSRTLAGSEVPGTRSRRTLIVPGTVRYALDLDRMGPEDLAWDAATTTLTIRRPRVAVLEPAADLARIQRFDEQGLLAPFTDADRELDALTRTEVARGLQRAAQASDLLREAEKAADAALARTFALPLRAAGMGDVRVVVRPQG
ncbi:MAG: DUF4230 domain-containing protein [Sphingomonadaceae bacterium]|uniref:DUF4230 domain-containing protein n=1 Tax=Thermaurantiacus sp. TaxID=2820283 RepID=UPI00298F35AA|nr:DUF4230 domain-containing protein [Thermaurantiacus sp.]MCS6986926.1 DUF4230 domain-containing protein [Sphingomonadaceae bacterium]MDW8415474.1 DUF4230 domain-containing protein [Thermaurantiacus sp.]